MAQRPFDERSREVNENDKFRQGVSEPDKSLVATTSDGRASVPNPAEFFNFFNPLAMPLKTWTRLYELHEDTGEFPRGLYFINETFIQFYFKVHSTNYYDIEVIENNILLLDDNVALELDETNGENPFPIIDAIFLELE